MLRALVAFVLLLMVAGVVVLATGGAATAAEPSRASQASFGFALAAGAIAMAATFLVARPRFRFRR